MIDADGTVHIFIKIKRREIKKYPGSDEYGVVLDVSKNLWEEFKAMPNKWICSGIHDEPATELNLKAGLFS